MIKGETGQHVGKQTEETMIGLILRNKVEEENVERPEGTVLLGSDIHCCDTSLFP